MCFGSHDATRLATLHNSAIAWAPDTQTQRHGVLAMMIEIRPYKPRDSARSALLTAVRNRRTGPCSAPPKGTILSYLTALRPEEDVYLIPDNYYLMLCRPLTRLPPLPVRAASIGLSSLGGTTHARDDCARAEASWPR